MLLHDLPFGSHPTNATTTCPAMTCPIENTRLRIAGQQTPVARAQPIWLGELGDGQHPATLARPPHGYHCGWANLGYPSRALRLKNYCGHHRRKHGGQIAPHYKAQLTLPAPVGTCTTSALLAFRHGIGSRSWTYKRSTSVGQISRPSFHPIRPPRRQKRSARTRSLPTDGHLAADVNLSLMEFGALVYQLSQAATRASCARAAPGHTPDSRRTPLARGHRPPGPPDAS